jgi:hypothetical protein
MCIQHRFETIYNGLYSDKRLYEGFLVFESNIFRAAVKVGTYSQILE